MHFYYKYQCKLFLFILIIQPWLYFKMFIKEKYNHLWKKSNPISDTVELFIKIIGLACIAQIKLFFPKKYNWENWTPS